MLLRSEGGRGGESVSSAVSWRRDERRRAGDAGQDSLRGRRPVDLAVAEDIEQPLLAARAPAVPLDPRVAAGLGPACELVVQLEERLDARRCLPRGETEVPERDRVRRDEAWQERAREVEEGRRGRQGGREVVVLGERIQQGQWRLEAVERRLLAGGRPREVG